MEKEVTLLEALSMCYTHKRKSKELVFEIRFSEVTRKAKFGKCFHKGVGQWIYWIHEDNCPSLVSNEKVFVSNIADISGIKTGMCVPSYKVYQIS